LIKASDVWLCPEESVPGYVVHTVSGNGGRIGEKAKGEGGYIPLFGLLP
jgi:hypothetical protein